MTTKVAYRAVNKRAVEHVIMSAEALLSACSELNLRCRDPPVVTSRLLGHLGVNQYVQRTVMGLLGELSGERIELYRHLRAEFYLRPYLERRKLMHVDGWVPVDFLDCKAMEGRCSISPRGLAGLIYIEGSVEGSLIRVNVVNLLRLLDITKPGSAIGLLEALRGLLWGRDVDGSLEELSNLTSIDAVRLVLPKVPEGPGDLVKLSPALREALKGLEV